MSRLRPLLAVGVTHVEGSFVAGDAVEIVGADGDAFAKGIVTVDADEARAAAGKRTDHLPEGPDELVHRDELVLLP